MPLRNNVTFKVAMPLDKADHFVGEKVAEYLVSAVERHAGKLSTIEVWRDCGYELDFTINEKRLHFAFAFVDHPQFHFYRQIASYVGWIRRLFGYQDERETDSLIRAIDQTLKNDPMFSEVAWHEAWYDEKEMTTSP